MQPTGAMKAAVQAAKGGFLLFIGDTSSTVILSIASMIVARLLGPSDYGLYSISLAIPSLMLLFTDFGVNAALIRLEAKAVSEGQNREIGDLIKTGVSFELVTGLLAFLISFSFSDFLVTFVVNRPSLTSLVRAASPLILGTVLLTTSSSVLVGLDQMERRSLLYILGAITKLLVAPALIVLGLAVSGAIIGHALSYIVAGSIGFLVSLNILRQTKYRPDSRSDHTPRLAPMIKYGMPFYVSALIGGTLRQYDTVLLSWFTSDIEIGNYSVAVIFSSIVDLLATPIATALFPAFSRLDSDNHIRDLRQFFLHSLRYTLLLILPASVFITVSSGDLIAFFYGSKYSLAPSYLRIYSMTFVLTGFSIVLGSFFSGIGKTDILLRSALINLCSVIPLSFIFARLWRVDGFICAVILAAILSVVYRALIARRNYGLEFGSKPIIRTLLASVVSSIPTLLVTLLPYSHVVKLLSAISVFAVTYLTIGPIVGSVGYVDLDNFRTIFRDVRIVSGLVNAFLSYEERILRIFHERPINSQM